MMHGQTKIKRNCRCKQVLIKEAKKTLIMHSQDNLAFKNCSRLKLKSDWTVGRCTEWL